MTDNTIGVDISKDHVDAFCMRNGSSRRFANDRQGHKALIAWIGDNEPRVIFEPTGPYHRAFERTLAAAGLALVKVNPRQARRFGEATGKLAKNRAKTIVLALLKRHNGQRLRQIERQIKAIEDAILTIIETDPRLARRFAILTSIPGVCAITAFALLIDMPELGTLQAAQAASLVGLAPVVRQSEKWSGRAFIRGGRANVRQALYMPALVACRFNPDFKAKYQQLIKAGKPAKVAITAIMRKLLILANALLSDDRKWAKSLP